MVSPEAKRAEVPLHFTRPSRPRLRCELQQLINIETPAAVCVERALLTKWSLWSWVRPEMGNAKRVYSQVHRACATKVAENKKIEEGEGGEPGRPPRGAAGVITKAQRRLSCAALNPELDKFCTKVKKAYFKMVQMYSRYETTEPRTTTQLLVEFRISRPTENVSVWRFIWQAYRRSFNF